MNAQDSEESRQALGARLREAREYLGYSQEEAAKALGLSRPAITNIESGQRNVQALELGSLARLYGRTVSYLMSGEEEPSESDPKVAFAARALQGLTPSDLDEVLRFAGYLRNSSKTTSRKDK
jgi:transcriptional regulator with XRE-family HTH domain